MNSSPYSTLENETDGPPAKRSSSLVNLSALPPDIIRKLLRLNKESIGEMRLISPCWNTIVVGTIEDNREPLERVFFTTNIDSRTTAEDDYAARGRLSAEAMEKLHSDSMRDVHMYAVLPDHYTGRVGVRQWLQVHNRFPGAIEAKCSPQKLSLNSKEREEQQHLFAILPGFTCLFLIIFPMLCGWLYFVVALLYFGSPKPSTMSWIVFVAIVSAIVVVVVVMYIMHQSFTTERGKGDKRRRDRLTRFFSSFSHIETLVLDGFVPYEDPLKATISSLGNVSIRRLEVIVGRCDNDFKKLMIKMVRKNQIQQVSIVAGRFIMSPKDIRDFILQLVKAGASVTICEAGDFPTVRQYFQQPVQYWRQLKRELAQEGISLNMSTIHDVNFIPSLFNVTIRARLTCVPTDIENGAQLPPVVRRGYKS